MQKPDNIWSFQFSRYVTTFYGCKLKPVKIRIKLTCIFLTFGIMKMELFPKGSNRVYITGKLFNQERMRLDFCFPNRYALIQGGINWGQYCSLHNKADHIKCNPWCFWASFMAIEAPKQECLYIKIVLFIGNTQQWARTNIIRLSIHMLSIHGAATLRVSAGQGAVNQAEKCQPLFLLRTCRCSVLLMHCLPLLCLLS